MHAAYDEILKAMAKRGRPECVTKTQAVDGCPILVLKDNSEIWFYFDKDKKLIDIRSYS